ncbi:uncharacterized protein LOC135651274 [Musa acuminata AAA Group]|uniref:uncharacterized protein LOC135651274 n=1 Tax=Musa acuminata AAA Group TaxID=214697 RepID=UPI0031DA108D
MASWSSITLALMLIFSMSKAQGAGVECERLDASACAYAVSSSGMRCVLERNAGGAYACATSEIGAEGFVDWVETEGCIAACGLDRRTVGISSDSLLDANFRRKLCSSECFRGCPNIVNLYFNLAASEGASFSCNLVGPSPWDSSWELRSREEGGERERVAKTSERLG